MTGALIRINQKVISGFEAAAVFCTIVIILSTSVQVFTRYVLGASLIGTEEVARYCFIWANMLGASICVNHHSHAVVSFLPDQLRGKLKTWHACLIQLIILAMALILIVQGLNMVKVTWNQLSPTLQVPMWLVYLSVPVGSVGILLGSICNILTTLSGKEEK